MLVAGHDKKDINRQYTRSSSMSNPQQCIIKEKYVWSIFFTEILHKTYIAENKTSKYDYGSSLCRI